MKNSSCAKVNKLLKEAKVYLNVKSPNEVFSYATILCERITQEEGIDTTLFLSPYRSNTWAFCWAGGNEYGCTFNHFPVDSDIFNPDNIGRDEIISELKKRLKSTVSETECC
jgi:hypothetical protein